MVETAPPESHVRAGDLVVATVRRPCPEALPALRDEPERHVPDGHFRERGIRGLHGFMSERYAESPRYLVKLAPHLRPFAVLLEPMSVVQKGIEQALRIQQRLAWEPRTAVVLGRGAGRASSPRPRCGCAGSTCTVVAREPEGCPRDDAAARGRHRAT